jgi:hypothetical protein
LNVFCKFLYFGLHRGGYSRPGSSPYRNLALGWRPSSRLRLGFCVPVDSSITVTGQGMNGLTMPRNRSRSGLAHSREFHAWDAPHLLLIPMGEGSACALRGLVILADSSRSRSLVNTHSWPVGWWITACQPPSLVGFRPPLSSDCLGCVYRAFTLPVSSPFPRLCRNGLPPPRGIYLRWSRSVSPCVLLPTDLRAAPRALLHHTHLGAPTPASENGIFRV